MTARTITTLALAAALGLGCTNERSASDADADATPDPGTEATDGPDLDVDDEEAAPECPPACPSAPADHAALGRPCLSELECGTGTRCMTESTEVFEDETYVSWLGGTCVLWGEDEAGCDPEDPATCPAGTACVYFGSNAGVEYHACVDACSFTDTSYNPLDWNCGCRPGYECNVNLEACLPGCTNDRECCEVWDDESEDGLRDAGEVLRDDTCSNWCDGDDPGEYPADDCMASFGCVNEGDASATWHSECLFDSDCPPGARCLNEVYYTDEDTDEPYYPGGLCLKDRCNLVGRGCGTDLGGECVNLSTPEDAFYACIATCETGYGPEDGDLNPCRHPAGGHPYTCSPWDPDHWYPVGTSNGLCFPATVPDADPAPMYGACTADGDCVSPKGLGNCIALMDKPSFCSALCDETLAADGSICGETGTGGAVPGVCALGICLPSCDTVLGTVGANGCPTATGLPDMACYPNDGTYGGPSFHATGGTAPAGFCLPACASTADCGLLWTGAVTCNPTTGVCG